MTLTLISNNSNISHKNCIKELIKLGYEKVGIVTNKGEISVKGDIIDIFPENQNTPIRCEFDINTIDRLSLIDIHTQTSYKKIDSITIKTVNEKSHHLSFDYSPHSLNSEIISDLFEGDLVVHEHYGIGIYEGLEFKEFNSVQGEYITIKYKNDDLVFVPLDHINIIHKYGQQEQNPPLNGLNEKKWISTKNKIKADTLKEIEALYKLYKDRSEQEGFKFSEDTELQIIVENQFNHELTPDQKLAIRDIKKDMESIRPMDRLLCGDVGYGKTEIMIRASLKALENNKQVVVLVPTTILADQHCKVFRSRLKDTPYMIESLSRFISTEKQKDIIKRLKRHQCDLVIGTHRILSKDIGFHDLGLLIIDEEQRFGVQHKDKIKSLKHNIDILNVSATPIPRTMYMAISNAKDISTIHTPPKHRKPILTKISALSKESIKEAILQEIKRDGQIFYVFNNIEKIKQKANQIKDIFPDEKVGLIHGRMNENEIKKILQEFLEQKLSILCSTTLIENGIDFPNANTIIIDGVELLGLAQIHQLRGRVGRSKIQAYAYLFYNSIETLSDKAKKRLQAIKEYISLGSGHEIALRDLEIRGSGNILSKQQHGHIITIGFRYYCKLLKESIEHKKTGAIDNNWLVLDTQKITIPSDYIENSRERLALYKRFMQCKTEKDCDHLFLELQDRYGKAPLRVKEIIEYIKDSIELAKFENY